MRTVSSTMRSQDAPRTPTSGTMNSRDLHYMHNTSASSGSHTLDMNATRETMDGLPHRIEQAEVSSHNSHQFTFRFHISFATTHAGYEWHAGNPGRAPSRD